MNPPALAAQRFLPAIVLGFTLGLCYGFLRPLRRKIPWLAELIFLFFMVWAWIYLSFGVCLGDLRPVYTFTMFFGALLWDRTLGQWLMPVIDGFWLPFFRFWGWFRRLLKIFFLKSRKFWKKLFPSQKKRGIINWNNRQHSLRRTGGTPHGK